MRTNSALPTGSAKKKLVREMFDTIAPTYEKANTFMTFGLDKYARKIAMKELRLAKGSTVLDLASGTGDFSRMLQNEGMNSFAADLSFNMLKFAKGTKDPVQCDGTSLPFADSTFDGVLCGYALRNFVDLNSLIIEMARVLKPGGKFIAVDVSVPTNPIIKFGNQLWFARIAPKIGRIISKNRQAYEYLPRSTSYMPDDEKLTIMFAENGFDAVRVSRLVATSLIMVVAAKPSVEV